MTLDRALCVGVACLSLVPATAHADDDAAVCVRAVEDAQVMHRAGKLRRAREGFITCAREVCPAPVKRDCASWLAEVTASIPSIVFAVRMRDGREVQSGHVTADGEPFVDTFDGRAVFVDPGAHTFVFDVANAKPTAFQTVVHEGEKNRLLSVTLDANASPLSPPPPPPTAASRPIPAGTWVAAGAAIVGLAGFTFFGLSGRNDLADLRATCVSHCAPDDVDAARQKLLIGDVFLAGGVVALAVGAWFFVTRPAVATDAQTHARSQP
jgi:hypothetical protein